MQAGNFPALVRVAELPAELLADQAALVRHPPQPEVTGKGPEPDTMGRGYPLALPGLVHIKLAPMPRLAFRNPPVHEVILALQVRDRADLKVLDGAAKLLSEPLLESQRAETHQVELLGTPTGEAGARVRREAVGWSFRTQGPTKVIQATRDALSIHAVRPGTWPVGPYPGWDVIGPWALGVFRELAPIYAVLGSKSASLRYLNRIAIPEHAELSEWFTIIPAVPRGLSELSVFQFGQTWERVEDHGNLSATVRLTKITIDNPEIQQGHQGALLDIEVFTRRSVQAPTYVSLTEWFEEAHGVENALFEYSITPKLADTFGRE